MCNRKCKKSICGSHKPCHRLNVNLLNKTFCNFHEISVKFSHFITLIVAAVSISGAIDAGKNAVNASNTIYSAALGEINPLNESELNSEIFYLILGSATLMTLTIASFTSFMLFFKTILLKNGILISFRKKLGKILINRYLHALSLFFSIIVVILRRSFYHNLILIKRFIILW